MLTRSKLLAAVLGLAVAVAAAGTASAKTTAKTVVIKSAAAQKVTRVHVGTPIVKHPVIAHTRIVRHVKLLHRAPSHVKVVGKVVAAPERVHIVKRPLLQKQAMVHRTIVKKTIIR